MESTQSAPTSPPTMPRPLRRRMAAMRRLAQAFTGPTGRTTALSCLVLTGELCTPPMAHASALASAPALAPASTSSDCLLRLYAQASEEVQRRILDRWDDEALLDADAPEWMRLHRDEWEWLLRERMESYCPMDALARPGRLAPVRLRIFVRGGTVADRTLAAGFERATTGGSNQYGLVGGVVLTWEWAP